MCIVLNFLGVKIMVIFTFVLLGKDKSHWSVFLFRLLKHVQTYFSVTSGQTVDWKRGTKTQCANDATLCMIHGL